MAGIVNGVGPWRAMEQRRAWQQQNAENSSRVAQSFARFDSTGWGEFTFDRVVEFNCTFTEEPYVTHGYALDGDQLVALRFPRAWGGVYRWKMDPRGFYTGCWVFIVVDTLSPAPIAGVPTSDPNYSLNHYFTFTGMAIKDLPDYLMDESTTGSTGV